MCQNSMALFPPTILRGEGKHLIPLIYPFNHFVPALPPHCLFVVFFCRAPLIPAHSRPHLSLALGDHCPVSLRMPSANCHPECVVSSSLIPGPYRRRGIWVIPLPFSLSRQCAYPQRFVAGDEKKVSAHRSTQASTNI